MVDAFRWMVFVIGLAVVIGSIMVTSAQNPTIEIYSPSDGDTVYSDTITVSGGASRGEGGVVVESVTVNEDPVDGKTSWRKVISLQPGSNKITAVATDTSGKCGIVTIYVTYIEPNSTPTNGPSPTPSPTPTTIPNGGYRPTPTPKPTVSISITSIPSGAKVYLDDFFKGITPIRENVTVGYHKIKVTKEGYHIYSETKKIRLGGGEPQELIIKLEPLTGSIYIPSTPSGASVYLDNVDMKAITPCMLKVVVGPHTIKLTKSGYFDAIRNVSIPPDGLLSLHETLTRCSYIDISSVPPGAEVHLDGNYKGETPKNISKVALGNHTINLTKSGYDDEIRTVSVSVAKTHPVYVNLRGYGYINISSDPSGARVYLDGNYTEVTPLYLHKLDEGNHSIRLTKRSYKDVTQEIHVSAGNTISVSVPLSLTRWGIIISDVMPVITAIAAVIAFFEFIYIISERKKRNE